MTEARATYIVTVEKLIVMLNEYVAILKASPTGFDVNAANIVILGMRSQIAITQLNMLNAGGSEVADPNWPELIN